MNPRAHAPAGGIDPKAPATAPPPPDLESAEKQDRRLDEELAETFPASDPIPVRHDS
jgi:hypothetical protein